MMENQILNIEFEKFIDYQRGIMDPGNKPDYVSGEMND